jgi:hypothetical protein
MTLKCPFTKTHKYHASSFWRENLKIKIGNPSQGAVSTAYLVFRGFTSTTELQKECFDPSWSWVRDRLRWSSQWVVIHHNFPSF